VLSAPSNFLVQTANLQVLLTFNNVATATSYPIWRSIDNVNFTQIAAPTVNSYTDVNVVRGTQYFYKVGSSTSAASFASGSLVLTGQPTNGQTFSVANVIFTAVTSGATGNEFNIASTIPLTLANIVSAVSADTSLQFIVQPSVSGSSVIFTAYQPGTEGNGIQLSTGMSNSAITTFSGGITGVNSPLSAVMAIVPVGTGEMTLGQVRLAAQQRADLVNSGFVSTQEWNSYITQSAFELYDLLVTAYEDYYLAPPALFLTNGNNTDYPLPDGITSFLHISGESFVAPPFYKMNGVDVGLSNNNNAWFTLQKFNWNDRNNFVYPQLNSTILGVFNMSYRVMGSKIQFIPVPSANQYIRLWYIPRMKQPLADTDILDGISGWTEYVIIDAAIKAMQKEESDCTVLGLQKAAIIKRIEDSAANRDASVADTITDNRSIGSRYGNNTSGSKWFLTEERKTCCWLKCYKSHAWKKLSRISHYWYAQHVLTDL
jgi:hypothetical protein